VAFVTSQDGEIAGRLTSLDGAAKVWVRGSGGALTLVPLRLLPSESRLANSVRDAATASLATAPDSATSRKFADCVSGRSGSLNGSLAVAWWRSAGTAPRPAAPGLALAEWAPRAGIFARFRSVEAAYRFVSAADELSSALLVAAEEDARDYGTVRWVLYDLLLPTIWRTNPGGEVGVGEVALVVAPPFVRGRLCAAAILRITDPELHRMQTTAGIALESSPAHRWRPSDDPFIDERFRRNFRVVPAAAPDVEIVATVGKFRDVVASRAAPSVADDPAYAALRSAPPAKQEAVFAWFPWASDGSIRDFDAFPDDARELRETLGLRHLAERLLGRSGSPARKDDRPRVSSAIASIVAVRVTTDAEGASTSVTCTDAGAAARFARTLSELPSAGPAADRACLHNLADLVPLALVENPQDDVAERNFVVLGWKPVCPCGGTYAVHPITREVSCSAHGTVKSPKSAKWTPPPISDVEVRDTELSFRLAIDWNRQR
jgi:hypothetical protein